MKRDMRTLAVALTATAALVPASMAVASHSHHNLWASSSGIGTSCTHSTPCTLATALGTATSGQTVRALKGTYTGGVVVTTKIHLEGERGVVLDATTSVDGIGIQVTPAGSGSSVEGFTVENATVAGIAVGNFPGVQLGVPTTDVSVSRNTLHNNGTSTTAPGWGIWLVSATNSTVARNRAYDNGGGVYLTDENGPNDHNRIVGNRILDNVLQCGITLAGHNPSAVNTTTLDPTGTAGVFDNFVADNVVNGNGTVGQGGGILMGGGVAYAGVYGNVIRDNTANDNGLAGVVIHQHALGDLNNNVIVGNRVRNDNLSGDTDFAPVLDNATTGILVASAAGPITGTVIARNSISHVVVGIWTLKVSSTTNTIAHNRFAKSVTTPILAN